MPNYGIVITSRQRYRDVVQKTCFHSVEHFSDKFKNWDYAAPKSRDGHRLLLRSECIVLLHSFKECSVLSCSFSNFLRLMKPKRTLRSFEKNTLLRLWKCGRNNMLMLKWLGLEWLYFTHNLSGTFSAKTTRRFLCQKLRWF